MTNAERVRQLAAKGRTPSEMVDELGISKQRVYQLLRKQGIGHQRSIARPRRLERRDSTFLEKPERFGELLVTLVSVYGGTQEVASRLNDFGAQCDGLNIGRLISVPALASSEIVGAVAKLFGVSPVLIEVGHWPPRMICMYCLGSGRDIAGTRQVPRIRAPRGKSGGRGRRISESMRLMDERLEEIRGKRKHQR